MPQSVLHICTDFWPSTGGIERFVLDLATRSASIGLNAAILCFDRVKSHPGQLLRTELICGIPVTRVPFVDLKFYKPALLPMGLLRRYDILHVHGPGALLDFVVLTKWLHRKRIVLSTHGGLFHTSTLLMIKRLYFFGLQRLFMPFVDAVAACSKTDATLFRRISKHVILLENAVDTSMYLALPRDEQQQGRCLHVGRLSDNKGVPDLLRAFAVAKQRGAQFELRLVGRDENGNREKYMQLAAYLGISGCVTFLGELDQSGLLGEYRHAQIFVSASHYEGFGLSAIEAKAAGCQLILNTNAAFSDIFSSDKAAILTSFADAEATAGVLIAALQGGGVMPIAIRQEVDAYSWPRKLDGWRCLYLDCIERRSPAI